jgi:hypothetical protein
LFAFLLEEFGKIVTGKKKKKEAAKKLIDLRYRQLTGGLNPTPCTIRCIMIFAYIFQRRLLNSSTERSISLMMVRSIPFPSGLWAGTTTMVSFFLQPNKEKYFC